ncbi:MAG: hypothetical protein OXH76_01060 [Boseongicola sp.]|nr:hypothetical protein [Boseongicola sp.]
MNNREGSHSLGFCRQRHRLTFGVHGLPERLPFPNGCRRCRRTLAGCRVAIVLTRCPGVSKLQDCCNDFSGVENHTL